MFRARGKGEKGISYIDILQRKLHREKRLRGRL